MNIRRLITLLLCALVATAVMAPAASGRQWVNYKRNSSLIHGTIIYNCDVSTCSASWRGGSGSGKDACQKNNWAPIGTYDSAFHSDSYAGSAIRGRVWRMSDYQCSNGVRRTELFIHSEETSSQGQSCGSGDQPFCWEGPNDYYSFGCIKISRRDPWDLARLDNWSHGQNGGDLNWISVSS
jgi:hypothetical protein